MGVAPVIIHFRLGFLLVNHPFGGPLFMDPPISVGALSPVALNEGFRRLQSLLPRGDDFSNEGGRVHVPDRNHLLWKRSLAAF